MTKQSCFQAMAAMVVLLLLLTPASYGVRTLEVHFDLKDSTAETYKQFIYSLYQKINSTGASWINSQPVLGHQSLRTQPAFWLKIHLTGSHSNSHVSFFIRSDNLHLSGFTNNKGQVFSFEGNEATLPTSTPLTFGGRYSDLFKPLDYRALEHLSVNKEAALGHLETLANFQGGRDEDLKKPLAFFILTICEAERFNEIEDAVCHFWGHQHPGTIDQYGVRINLVVNWGEASCAILGWKRYGQRDPAWNRIKEARKVKKLFDMATAANALSRVKTILQVTKCSWSRLPVTDHGV